MKKQKRFDARPIVVDLFAGAGGLSLGFEQAGFEVSAAVEVDPVHASVHKFNFPQTTVIPRSVSELDGASIREMSSIGDAEIAAVVGGAPCQGFSMIGKRALDDPRNALVRDFVRIVKELSPMTFLFENVKGLTLGAHRRFLDELVEEFVAAGYSVSLPWKVLDAQDYGVPQHRERLFLIGAREPRWLAAYPGASPERVTVWDAIGDLPLAGKQKVSGLAEPGNWREPSPYAAALRVDRDKCWGYGYRRGSSSKEIANADVSVHSEITKRRFRETAPGHVEPISRFLKLNPNGVANTLRAGSDATRGAFTSPRPIHPYEPRCVTVREMARLHGFPDWFRFNETTWHGAREIGNAVAPPVARAIAVEIAKAIGYKPIKPRKILQLGDESLLKHSLESASEYWGIPYSPQRRTQKSGVKKRSQTEIEQARAELFRERRELGRRKRKQLR